MVTNIGESCLDVPYGLMNLQEMGCPVRGIWVGFLKQPDALPGRALQKNKKYIFLNYF
jgi:hypothetical protein